MCSLPTINFHRNFFDIALSSNTCLFRGTTVPLFAWHPNSNQINFKTVSHGTVDGRDPAPPAWNVLYKPCIKMRYLRYQLVIAGFFKPSTLSLYHDGPSINIIVGRVSHSPNHQQLPTVTLRCDLFGQTLLDTKAWSSWRLLVMTFTGSRGRSSHGELFL